ncbi:MAG: TetR/AcrR family transcriptional regulator C-terminal domain-containing protein [Acidimicrobiia bacterium]
MVSQTDTSTEPRTPLSKDRVLQAAVALADAQGIEGLTMRNLAAELSVEAMSLYYHVANKEALLNGVVDTVIAEIEQELGGFDIAAGETDWMEALRTRILTARTVMLRHPWAPEIIETRTIMTPVLLRYMDTLLGIMVEGGFSNDLGHHALHALGSRALGFNQELFEPDDPSESDEEAMAMLQDLAPQLPYIIGMMADISHDDPDSTLGWCDDQTEFEFGLDLILNGLEAHRTGS